MLSRHSVLITRALSGMGAVDADCFSRHGSDAGTVRRGRSRTRSAFQRGSRLTDQSHAHRENDFRLEERGRECARIVHEVHDTFLPVAPRCSMRR